MAAFSNTKLTASFLRLRCLHTDTKFALPEPVAETRSLLHLLELVAENQNPVFRILKPAAIYFRGCARYGGRVLQSSSVCAVMLLADTNEDYIAQVAKTSSIAERTAYLLPQASASAAAFAGSWDMKGGDADALTSLEKTLLRKKMMVNE